MLYIPYNDITYIDALCFTEFISSTFNIKRNGDANVRPVYWIHTFGNIVHVLMYVGWLTWVWYKVVVPYPIFPPQAAVSTRGWDVTSGIIYSPKVSSCPKLSNTFSFLHIPGPYHILRQYIRLKFLGWVWGLGIGSYVRRSSRIG